MRSLKSSMLLFGVCLVSVPLAEARPFRAMGTRTAITTGPQHLEAGLRYQGFFGGDDLDSLGYHQLTPSARFGIVKNLEVNLAFDVMLLTQRGSAVVSPYAGDAPLGLQFTFIDTPHFALGAFGRLTIPVGAGNFEQLAISLQDRIPPSLSDGTWDAEGTLIIEVRPTTSFRVMGNAGYLFHGTRQRPGAGAFDVPDAIRYDVAATVNLGDQWLIGVEMLGRSYFAAAVTPVWTDNAHQIEVLPSVRFEPIPNLVIEAAVGIGLTRGLGDIYRARALLGFTYEFDILGSNRVNVERG